MLEGFYNENVGYFATYFKKYVMVCYVLLWNMYAVVNIPLSLLFGC